MSGKKTVKISRSKWRYPIGFIVSLVFIFIVIIAYSACIRPSTKKQELPYSKEEIAYVQKNIKPPKTLDKSAVVNQPITEKEYKTAEDFFNKNKKASGKDIKEKINKGELPAWYPHNEAPVLKELVKEGLLPPVAERVGPEPMVAKGCDGIGKYGGTWLRLAFNPINVKITHDLLSGSYLFRFSPLIYPSVPQIAKSIKQLDKGKIWEIKLRKVKWSDGHPFTADDVMFWWNDYTLNSEIGPGSPPNWMMVGGEYGKIVKVDKHTVRFVFPKPYGTFQDQITRYQTFMPAHYLKQFISKYGDKKFIDAKIKAYGLTSVKTLFSRMANLSSTGDPNINPECPSMNPWIIRTYTSKSPYVFVRNPYYYAVDEEGNQLPYIDRIQYSIYDHSMMTIAAAMGKVSMQDFGFKDYTSFVRATKEYNMKIYYWILSRGSNWLISPNLLRLVKPDEPSTKWKAELLRKKEFRQALSVAINRKQIIEALFYNLVQPGQVEPGPLTPYHSEKLRTAYTKYNPKQANKMLDDVWRKLGWDPDKRVEGYRCGPDGKLITFYMDVPYNIDFEPTQFVIDDWKAVGIRCIYRLCDSTLYVVRKSARDLDFSVWGSVGELVPYLSAQSFVACNLGSTFATGWALWNYYGGMYGSESSKNPGCIPIPKNNPMYKAVQYFNEGLQAPTLAKRKYYLDKVFDIDAENIYTINISNPMPQLVVASKDMKNIPQKAVLGYAVNSPGNSGTDTFYFEHPEKSTYKDTLAQLKHITPMPTVNKDTTVKVDKASQTNYFSIFSILPYAFIIIILLLVVLLCMKHPFALRRICIMVPTLFIISICVFTIIQLPPGTYLDYKIMQLQEQGVRQQQVDSTVKELKELFHYDEPAWEKYCQWMGFDWFVSYDETDKGLLQGYMGRSMETLTSVNEIIGDRILLTFLIALGTIILTWLLAIPIGIYSASKQYSFLDYVFTVFGFLGMCFPGFLIALILLVLTGQSGLFSNKYLVQPFWDLGKVIDLMKHIWLPVVIVAFSGTASMIRVMRANLLDELKKPYVTTAKAKGVRPIKLLLKYPVRLALNPFISGIGGLFPALISGSSIVAIVLSLPTVSPELLAALKSQDMYLAGSMLMVLAVLSIIGTLVSDLLLIALDPRIRVSGGNK